LKSLNLLSQLLPWQPLIAALINAAIALSLAIWVSYGLTAALKRTEFSLDFTKRFHAILVEVHKLDNRIKTEPGPLDNGDAHQIYFQLFGLMYDEVSAYQDSFLAKKLLVDWMTWQMHEFGRNDFRIGAVSYQEGWKAWLATPAEHHRLTPVMQRIFACENENDVRRAIAAIPGKWAEFFRR
jgi:hypothetical protein